MFQTLRHLCQLSGVSRDEMRYGNRKPLSFDIWPMSGTVFAKCEVGAIGSAVQNPTCQPTCQRTRRRGLFNYWLPAPFEQL